MESWTVLLKAGVALVWVCSLVYLPMKWWANRFWPTPAAPISLSGDPPFWSRATWAFLCVFTVSVVALVSTRGGGDSVSRRCVGVGPPPLPSTPPGGGGGGIKEKKGGRGRSIAPKRGITPAPPRHR